MASRENGSSVSNKNAITDGAMRIVREVVLRTHTTDRFQLLSAICEDLEGRYAGETFDYHVAQMNLKTTADILRAIDVYFIMKEFYPELDDSNDQQAAG